MGGIHVSSGWWFQVTGDFRWIFPVICTNMKGEWGHCSYACYEKVVWGNFLVVGIQLGIDVTKKCFQKQHLTLWNGTSSAFKTSRFSTFLNGAHPKLQNQVTNQWTSPRYVEHREEFLESEKNLRSRYYIPKIYCNGTKKSIFCYPPVNKHSNGKSPSWIGNTSSNGGFSIAMLDYQRVPSEMNIDIPQKDCYRVSELSPPPKQNEVLLGMFFSDMFRVLSKYKKSGGPWKRNSQLQEVGEFYGLMSMFWALPKHFFTPLVPLKMGYAYFPTSFHGVGNPQSMLVFRTKVPWNVAMIRSCSLRWHQLTSYLQETPQIFNSR